MTRELYFVRGAEGELAPRMLHTQTAAVRIHDVPLLYSDEETLEIIQAVDGAISLAGTHSWRDIVGSGTAAGVLDEAEVSE